MTLREMSDVMEYLYSSRAAALPAASLADVFDRLVWCLEDNGTAITRVQESWLASEDRGKVEIALAMNEVHPFRNPDELDRVLSSIVARWPDLSLRCSELRSERTELESRLRAKDNL